MNKIYENPVKEFNTIPKTDLTIKLLPLYYLHKQGEFIMKKIATFFIISAAIFFLSPQTVFSHCDTMDGPVIIDAQLAFEKNNVNYVLKWVRSGDENDIKKAFAEVMKVRPLNADAKELAEKYFYDILIRIHREGEGVSFTGVKPSGTPVSPVIKAADKSIELENLSALEKLIPDEKRPRLKKLFNKAMSLKKFDIDDVKAGREYVEAYVQFFHFAEGEEAHNHGEHAGHLAFLIPIILSGIFFLSTIILGALYFRIKKN